MYILHILLLTLASIMHVLQGSKQSKVQKPSTTWRNKNEQGNALYVVHCKIRLLTKAYSTTRNIWGITVHLFGFFYSCHNCQYVFRYT